MSNGNSKNCWLKIIYWLTFIIITVSLGLGSWNLSATVDHNSRIGRVEMRVSDGKEQLNKRECRVDKKFDSLEKKMVDGFSKLSEKLDKLIQRELDSVNTGG